MVFFSLWRGGVNRHWRTGVKSEKLVKASSLADQGPKRDRIDVSSDPTTTQLPVEPDVRPDKQGRAPGRPGEEAKTAQLSRLTSLQHTLHSDRGL